MAHRNTVSCAGKQARPPAVGACRCRARAHEDRSVGCDAWMRGRGGVPPRLRAGARAWGPCARPGRTACPHPEEPHRTAASCTLATTARCTAHEWRMRACTHACMVRGLCCACMRARCVFVSAGAAVTCPPRPTKHNGQHTRAFVRATGRCPSKTKATNRTGASSIEIRFIKSNKVNI